MIPSLERARQRGRELFLTVLGRELVAHRSLWIGTALVFLCAAFVWPLMSDEGFTSLRLLLSTGAACGAVTALYLIGLIAVLISVRSTTFPDTVEGRAFMKGAVSGFLFAALPALPAIIGALLLCFL